MEIEHSKPVPPFVKFCAANIPMVFDDSLSYYEALCALWNWLQTDVIDVINNNASATEAYRDEVYQYKQAVDQLHDYVENYFANLDVQQEINNKLDDMAEQGVLADIISQYLNSVAVFGYDTVASMKSSVNLIDGSYARTVGFHAKNDGGGAMYRIRHITNDDVVDESTIIEMGDGSDELIAELIVEEPINVKVLGAYGDGTHDDYAKIQLGIDKFKHKTIYFPSGNYLISQPLSIGTANADQVDLKLESDAVLKTNLVIDSLLEIGKSGTNYSASGEGMIVTIDGGVFDATNCQRAIYTTDIRKNTMLKNIIIKNVSNYGIYIAHVAGENLSSDANIENVVITGTGSEGSSTGMYLVARDNKVRNCRVNSCHIGIYDNGGSYYQNVHVLGYWHDGQMTQSNYESSIAFKIDGAGGVVKMQECYNDTMGIGWQINNDTRVYISNSQSYHYLSNLEYKTILFDYNYSNATGRLFVTQFDYNPPTVTGSGTNVGLDLSGTSTDFRSYLTTYWVFKFSQIDIYHTNANTLSDNDYIFCKSLYDEDSYVSKNAWQFTMQANKYYPIAILRGVSAYNLQIGMAFDQLIEASFTSDSVGRMSVRNLINFNHTNEYTLALCNFDTVDGIRQSYLCIKSTTASSFNPSIKGFHNWNNQVMIRPYYSSTPLENPTVVTESSFNS